MLKPKLDWIGICYGRRLVDEGLQREVLLALKANWSKLMRCRTLERNR